LSKVIEQLMSVMISILQDSPPNEKSLTLQVTMTSGIPDFEITYYS
jgi:hypothetical protein